MIQGLKRGLVIIFLLLLVNSIVTFAVETIDKDVWNDMSASEKAEAANSPSTQLTKDQLRQVDAKKLDSKAVDKYVSELSDSQLKDLKANQITQESYKKITPKSKLSDETLSEFTSDHTGVFQRI